MANQITELTFLEQLAKRFKIPVPEVICKDSAISGPIVLDRSTINKTLGKWGGKALIKPDILTGRRGKAGRSGNFNPHLHILCTSGGKTRDGRWKEFGFIDFDLLHTKWQYYLLRMLRENMKSPVVDEEIDKCWRNYPDGLVAYIEKGDVPEGGRGLAQYLAKYVVSPPISLRRIIKYDGKNVRYWYNDHTTGRRKEEEVDALTFIGRMVQHILPKGFQRIRYYGLHATCKASRVKEDLKGLVNDTSEASVGTYRVTGYRNRIKESFGIDPLLCPRCGDEMEFEGIWHPEYGWIVNNWDSLFHEEVPVHDDG